MSVLIVEYISPLLQVCNIPDSASVAISRFGDEDEIDGDDEATSGVKVGGGGKLESLT